MQSFWYARHSGQPFPGFHILSQVSIFYQKKIRIFFCFSLSHIFHPPTLTHVYLICNSTAADSSFTPYTLVFIFFSHKFFRLSQTSQERSCLQILITLLQAFLSSSPPPPTYPLRAPAYAGLSHSY